MAQDHDLPELIPSDHAFKIIARDGLSRNDLRDQMQEMVNRLAGKGCTFFQADENDDGTVVIMSGWYKQPRLPNVPYVDRSELEMPKVPA